MQHPVFNDNHFHETESTDDNIATFLRSSEDRQQKLLMLHSQHLHAWADVLEINESQRSDQTMDVDEKEMPTPSKLPSVSLLTRIFVELQKTLDVVKIFRTPVFIELMKYICSNVADTDVRDCMEFLDNFECCANPEVLADIDECISKKIYKSEFFDLDSIHNLDETNESFGFLHGIRTGTFPDIDQLIQYLIEQRRTQSFDTYKRSYNVETLYEHQHLISKDDDLMHNKLWLLEASQDVVDFTRLAKAAEQNPALDKVFVAAGVFMNAIGGGFLNVDYSLFSIFCLSAVRQRFNCYSEPIFALALCRGKLS